MSTPTTATATLPPIHQISQISRPFHFPGFLPTASFRPSAPRVPFNETAATSSHTSSYGTEVAPGSSSNTLVAYDSPYTYSHDYLSNSHKIMPPPSKAIREMVDQPKTRKKRQRSREPDWDEFYKNGLPKEVIVIDGTPEPEMRLPPSQPSATTTGAAPPAKRRRRGEGTSTRYDPVHNQSTDSKSNTPRRNGVSVGSSDWTNVAVSTTAPTSLSSNGSQYEQEAQVGNKRKRTTRQQVAIEARRRKVGGPSDLNPYLPPSLPIKKAGDVPLRVVRDVCSIRHTFSAISANFILSASLSISC
jgi:dual-specificity kinase